MRMIAVPISVRRQPVGVSGRQPPAGRGSAEFERAGPLR